MNTTVTFPAVDDEWMAAVVRACERVAPTWPLDQLIAVNPFWGMRDEHVSRVAARVAALGRARMLAPEALQNAAQSLRVADGHLTRAATELGLTPDADDWRAADAGRGDAVGHWHNISDLLDSERDLQQRMSWHEEIVDQVSQFCASVFQRPGEDGAGLAGGELYARWRRASRDDRSIPILMGEPGLSDRFADLPARREELFAETARVLDIDDSLAEAYAHALLMDVNGWASWVAYLRWQQRLNDDDLDLMPDLLAIRMAWDLLLWRHVADTDPEAFHRMAYVWRRQGALLPGLLEEHAKVQQRDWVWQRGAEIAFQERLSSQLRAVRAPDVVKPVLQAVFCIDVRSEVIRRCLEEQDPTVQTVGFAGFFGLPVAYRQAGSDLRRPQLPGLLAPSFTVSEAGSADRARSALGLGALWSSLPDAPPAMFSLVETVGPLYAWRLLHRTLKPKAASDPAETSSQLELSRNQQALSASAQAELAAGILHAMGLEDDFAPTVMLVGHGSSTRNNPHAASLACGACGGQSGAVNVRLLAGMLNDPAVRAALAERGTRIPPGTRFVPALHDTTTDEIRCLDGAALPERLQAWIDGASRACRRERATSLGLATLSDAALLSALRRRAGDWSEVRPEWGLAGNAAFVAAPRERTRGLDLGGRVFLHDYRWQTDRDGAVLELIMTAPLVVAHWINMQYNASVADNGRFGSGSKALHNVVGGRLGVFEGHGGDLRIGLPMQSLHDGDRWMHTPLRLSGYLCAPREAIERVYQRHDVVRQLIDNEWLFLFRLDEEGDAIERLLDGGWVPA